MNDPTPASEATTDPAVPSARVLSLPVRWLLMAFAALCVLLGMIGAVVPGMPTVIYGKVDEALGRRIVQDHVGGKQLIDAAICDRPAVDIVR